MIKIILIGFISISLFGCASRGELYERGEYIETVCTKKLFKKEVCVEVTKKGLHVTKKMKIRGTGAEFDFKDGEEKGKGATFVPDLSGLQLKNQ